MSVRNGPGRDFPGLGVVFFCHDGQGNILLSKRGMRCRDEQGRWDVGGGAIEFGQTIEQTVRDEIQEEFRTGIFEMTLLGVREVFRTQDGIRTHWIAFDYLVHVDRAKVQNGEPHKFDELKWFTLDTLPPDAELHSQFPTFLAKYRKVLKQHLALV